MPLSSRLEGIESDDASGRVTRDRQLFQTEGEAIMVTACPGYSTEFDPSTIFRRILIPVDYSPESRRAMMTACETRRRFDSEIFLFVVCEAKENTTHRGGVGSAGDPEEIELRARQQLRCFADNVCQGVPCTACDAVYGDDVVEGIAEAVQRCGATMVMLPYHPSRSFLRSAAEKIVRRLEVPVFVLNLGEEPAEASPPPPKVALRGDKPVILSPSGRIIANPRWLEPCQAQGCESCAGSR